MSSGTEDSQRPAALPLGRRFRLRTAAIALSFVPVFGLDPNNILRLDAEAHAARDLDVVLAGAAEQARYSYDDNGNLVLVELWDPAADDGEGAFVAKDEYRYDPENRLTAHDPAPPDKYRGYCPRGDRL